jgi:dGTPase
MNTEETTGLPLEKDRDRIKRVYLNPLKGSFIEEHFHMEESRYRPNGTFQRDYARVMYSSSFRRLQGKMQLLGIKNDQFFRNRLTHSLEVAQIARSIAEMIQYDLSELYVVEAGALAHDLGNPPFGHAGERRLNELFREVGGFEGNAQTLRILTTVEKKRPGFRGLNLTYRSLLAVVKYFNQYDPDHIERKFIYKDDYELLKRVIDKNEIKVRTLDVQIVDIADEIAYAAHDLEDGLRVKAYTIDEILHDFKAKYGDGPGYQKFQEIVADTREKSGFGDGNIESTEYSKLFRQELASRLINLAMNDIGFIPVDTMMAQKTGTQQTEELGFLNYGELIHGLKEIVFKCINHNDEVYHYEERGIQIIDFLTELYAGNPMYLPPEYRANELRKQYKDLNDYDKDTLQKRLICDYIAGMMDSFAILSYEKYSGKNFDDMDMRKNIEETP